MKIGCPKEVKNQEYRVGLTPNDVYEYVHNGHEVFIEYGAGLGINFTDEDYIKAGAKMATKEELFAQAEMIVKVKEPIECEYDYFRPNTILFTYLHLAADEALTRMLLEKNILSIAYETIQEGRNLPCLAPMSSIAGRLATIQALKYSEKIFGGSGQLLTGVPGVSKGKMVILGAGVVGLNAAQLAVGMGIDVTIVDLNLERLAYVDQMFDGKVTTLYSNKGNIIKAVQEADAIVGAVLIPGAKAPKLITREHLKLMKPGTVLVDVAIDQGGCFETSRATTHTDPIFIEEGVVHYCVANMPGAVARTSTMALVNATTKYGLIIANEGARQACRNNPALRLGLNTIDGKCTYQGVAEAFGLEYVPAEQCL